MGIHVEKNRSTFPLDVCGASAGFGGIDCDCCGCDCF